MFFARVAAALAYSIMKNRGGQVPPGVHAYPNSTWRSVPGKLVNAAIECLAACENLPGVLHPDNDWGNNSWASNLPKPI